MDVINQCVESTCFGNEPELNIDELQALLSTPRQHKSIKHGAPIPIKTGTPLSVASTQTSPSHVRVTEPSGHPSNYIDPAYEYCVDYIAMQHLGDRYFLTHPLPFPSPPIQVTVKRKTEPDLLPVVTALIQLTTCIGESIRRWYHGLKPDFCPDYHTLYHDQPVFDRALYNPPRIVHHKAQMISHRRMEPASSSSRSPIVTSGAPSPQPVVSDETVTLTYKETSGDSSSWDGQDVNKMPENHIFWTPNQFPPHPKYYAEPID